MGLRIVAHEKVTFLGAVQNASEVEKGVHYLYCPFDGAKETFGSLVRGWYSDNGSAKFDYSVGSYGGYCDWREKLAAMVGTTPARVWSGERAIAFQELINFSDCDGAIAPEVCRKLAADFDKWASVAAEHFDEDGLETYEEFRRAFHHASNGGAVQFH